MKLFALLAGSLLLTCAVVAQESDEPFRGPDRGTIVRVPGIQILPAAERPFSGRDHIEWTRTLEDGTVVTTHLYAALARDSQGRIYREHMSFVPANSNQQSRRREIDLLDPVAHTRTTCMVATRRCTITEYHASTTFTPQPAGPFDHGRRTLARENLGTDVVDGLNLIGTRETVSISAGAVGNSQPLVTTKEYWYSPDLQVNLAVIRKDPREGTQVIRVVDLSRTEPDPAMFEIPSGYVVQDIR
ncbi:MAG: hypothetical protein ACLPHP_02845 [Candidatus Sulfotelmatobacter sp.]